MADNSSPQITSTVQLISRQESTIRSCEKDTCLHHSELELREKAHKEVHKETHLGRAKALVTPLPGVVRALPSKARLPPLRSRCWARTPASPTSSGWVGFRQSLWLCRGPAPALPHCPLKNKGMEYSYNGEQSKTKRKLCRKTRDQGRPPCLQWCLARWAQSLDYFEKINSKLLSWF